MFLGLIADLHRYIAETGVEPLIEGAAQSSSDLAAEFYEKALEAGASMPKHHPIYLGVCLNYAVYYFETRKNPQKAASIAKKAAENSESIFEEKDYSVKRDAMGI